MVTTTTSNLEETKENPAGVRIGQSASALVGFYGATPVAQQTDAAQAAVGTAAATTTTPHGFATGTQADAIVSLVNEIRSVLVTVGLMKGS